MSFIEVKELRLSRHNRYTGYITGYIGFELPLGFRLERIARLRQSADTAGSESNPGCWASIQNTYLGYELREQGLGQIIPMM